MGRTKGLYEVEYPVGSIVRIADRETLERFLLEWSQHNKLDPSQLSYAGIEGKVSSVAFYHGGDELYKIDNVPGVWHEQCLESA
jgi:hypothetical protein